MGAAANGWRSHTAENLGEVVLGCLCHSHGLAALLAALQPREARSKGQPPQEVHKSHSKISIFRHFMTAASGRQLSCVKRLGQSAKAESHIAFGDVWKPWHSARITKRYAEDPFKWSASGILFETVN